MDGGETGDSSEDRLMIPDPHSYENVVRMLTPSAPIPTIVLTRHASVDDLCTMFAATYGYYDLEECS